LGTRTYWSWRTGDAISNFISWIAQIEEKNSNSSSDDDDQSNDTPIKISANSNLLKFNYFVFFVIYVNNSIEKQMKIILKKFEY